LDVAKAEELLRKNHRAIFCARRKDGSPLMSPVACALEGPGTVVVSTRETAAKARAVARDPRVSLCVVPEAWYGEWLQIDGTAELIHLPEAMDGLVAYYRTVAGEHPDWDEYREAMEKEKRLLVRITIERAGPDVHG
jgi:PPOX class probable F420-dependent enzyme